MTDENDWINTYWEAMLRSDFETAIPLKEDRFPANFFKHKILNEWTIKSLEENQIHLAEMESLNDPFECMLQFDNDKCLRLYHSDQKFQQIFAKNFGPLTKAEIESLTTDAKPYEIYLQILKKRGFKNIITSEQQLSRMQRRFTEMTKEDRKKLRVTCFTQRNDSLLMWAHYSNEHKEICMEYDLQGEDHIRPFLQPVRYSNQVHKIGLFEEMDIMSLVCSSLVKSVDWSYEAEWRITTFRQGANFPQKVKVPGPTAVYLGTRFEINDTKIKDQLLTLLHRKNIPVFQMERHSNEYRLISKKTSIKKNCHLAAVKTYVLKFYGSR